MNNYFDHKNFDTGFKSLQYVSQLITGTIGAAVLIGYLGHRLVKSIKSSPQFKNFQNDYLNYVDLNDQKIKEKKINLFSLLPSEIMSLVTQEIFDGDFSHQDRTAFMISSKEIYNQASKDNPQYIIIGKMFLSIFEFSKGWYLGNAWDFGSGTTTQIIPSVDEGIVTYEVKLGYGIYFKKEIQKWVKFPAPKHYTMSKMTWGELGYSLTSSFFSDDYFNQQIFDKGLSLVKSERIFEATLTFINKMDPENEFDCRTEIQLINASSKISEAIEKIAKTLNLNYAVLKERLEKKENKKLISEK